MKVEVLTHGLVLGLALGIVTGALGVAFAGEALPAIPENAALVEAFLVPCPDGNFIGIAGFDTNGNGDYEVADVTRGGIRIAVVYFDAVTEAEVVKVVIVEGGMARVYTNIPEFLAKYPGVCDIPTPQAGVQT